MFSEFRCPDYVFQHVTIQQLGMTCVPPWAYWLSSHEEKTDVAAVCLVDGVVLARAFALPDVSPSARMQDTESANCFGALGCATGGFEEAISISHV